MDEDLLRCVDPARARSLALRTLRELLRAAGWKDTQIAGAFGARALELP